MTEAAFCVVGRPSPPMTTTARSTVVRELTADDIRWTLSTLSLWPPAAPVIAVAIAALPAVEDVIAARLIQRQVHTLVDVADELRSVRAVLSASMTWAYEQQLVLDRLHQQVVEMREAARAQGRAAA